MKTLRLTYQLIAIPAAFSLSACHTQSSQQQPSQGSNYPDIYTVVD